MQSVGSLGGKGYAEALGINDSGQVVGASETSLGPRAFLWSKAGGSQDINSLIPPTHDVLLVQGTSYQQSWPDSGCGQCPSRSYA